MEYVNFGKAGVKVSPLALGLGFRGQGDENAAKGLLNTPSIPVSTSSIARTSMDLWTIAPTSVALRRFSVKRFRESVMTW